MRFDEKVKKYDLEDRTFEFAKDCRDFTKQIEKCTSNFEYQKQLIRSSGSVAANYIEANESLSKKDFIHRVKICRKEAKESRLWLNLIEISDIQGLINNKNKLVKESTELIKIFSKIIENSSS